MLSVLASGRSPCGGSVVGNGRHAVVVTAELPRNLIELDYERCMFSLSCRSTCAIPLNRSARFLSALSGNKKLFLCGRHRIVKLLLYSTEYRIRTPCVCVYAYVCMHTCVCMYTCVATVRVCVLCEMFSGTVH